MYVVCVHFTIKENLANEFLLLMQNQASNSLQLETGCEHFDVCVDPNNQHEVFLYEIYAGEQAFQQHLSSDHFKDFDQKVASMVADKSVKIYHKISS